MVEKSLFVKDLREKQRVQTHFLVRSKTTPLNKKGDPYLNLVLSDKTGDIEGRVWENVQETSDRFDAGDIVLIDAIAQNYQGRLQLRINNIGKVDRNEVNIEDYLPTSPVPINRLWDETKQLLNSVTNPELKKLIYKIYDDKPLVEAIKRAPAAKEIHHNFVGGLLYHTLSMMKVANFLASHYNILNRDLLILGAFLHDIGKTRELSVEQFFEYTDEGKLLGHIVIGDKILTELISKVEDFPRELAYELRHILLSHHGDLSKGSPKVPVTMEALIISFIDEMDARVENWKKIFEREDGRRWTSFQKMYERSLYRSANRDGNGDSSSEEFEGFKPFAQMNLIEMMNKGER
ncbi:MAG: 3'-5' exoribonuclease YhaM family protein [Myxococcota bacterium]